MTSKNVTNNSVSPLGLPNGQIVDPKKTVLVKNWEKVESNSVVQSWIAAAALTVADAPESDDDAAAAANAPAIAPVTPASDNTPAVPFVPKTADELKGMTNADLANHIEKELGGEVKSGSTKDDLLAQVKTLSDAKVAANVAATSAT